MKKLVAGILLPFLLLTACVKSLDKEGIVETTIYIGRVVHGTSGIPVANVNVMVISGSRIYANMTTGDDGRFELSVKYREVTKDHYILLEDGIHPSKKSKLKGFGMPVYDFRDIIFYE